MCTLIYAVEPLKHLGYKLSDSKHLVHLLQYANDTHLIENAPARAASNSDVSVN